jgi:hypothetical protein
MTSDQAALREELTTVENDLAGLRSSAAELREQIATEGPADPGDVATLLTGAQEQEALAAAMQRRRDELRRQLGLDAAG